MQIIDGKHIAAQVRQSVKKDVETLQSSGIKPALAVILVGDDPASHVYVRNKIKACEDTGIISIEKRLPADTDAETLLSVIDDLNNDEAVHGILLQLPLPDHLDSGAMTHAIKPEKDVDGLHPVNIGKLVAGLDDGLVPCTPQGSVILIKSIEQNLSGKHAVVIGRSLLFGKPVAQLLLAENCTVTTCHSRTQNIASICRKADILIAAVGSARLVQKDWVKEGAIVIDVGVNRLDDGKLCGDVDFEAVKSVARAITPVPGGVGPMTIACLLQNTVKAAKASA